MAAATIFTYQHLFIFSGLFIHETRIFEKLSVSETIFMGLVP